LYIEVPPIKPCSVPTKGFLKANSETKRFLKLLFGTANRCFNSGQVRVGFDNGYMLSQYAVNARISVSVCYIILSKLTIILRCARKEYHKEK